MYGMYETFKVDNQIIMTRFTCIFSSTVVFSLPEILCTVGSEIVKGYLDRNSKIVSLSNLV